MLKCYYSLTVTSYAREPMFKAQLGTQYKPITVTYYWSIASASSSSSSFLKRANTCLFLFIFVLFLLKFQLKLKKVQMVCLGFEPRAAEWQAQTKPRSYGGHIIANVDAKTLMLFIKFFHNFVPVFPRTFDCAIK